MSDTSPPNRLRADCHQVARILSVLCVAVSALIVLDACGPWLVHRPGAGVMIVRVIGLVAPAAYMTALWALGRVLKSFALTGRFAAAQALSRVGWALTAGGAFQILIAPGLDAALGHGPGYWIGLDPAAIAVAALGIALVVFARLFKRAARMEAELEGIL